MWLRFTEHFRVFSVTFRSVSSVRGCQHEALRPERTKPLGSALTNVNSFPRKLTMLKPLKHLPQNAALHSHSKHFLVVDSLQFRDSNREPAKASSSRRTNFVECVSLNGVCNSSTQITEMIDEEKGCDSMLLLCLVAQTHSSHESMERRFILRVIRSLSLHLNHCLRFTFLNRESRAKTDYYLSVFAPSTEWN